MINGKSYKWIVAEAAKKALGMDRIQERIFIVKLVNDKNDPNRDERRPRPDLHGHRVCSRQVA